MSEKPRHARRGLVWGMLLLLALLVVAGTAAVGYWLWNSEPPEYLQALADRQEQDPEQLERLADNAFNTMTREVSAPPDPHVEPQGRTIRLTTDQINAFLATRLEEWLSHADIKLPKSVQDPIVVTDEGDTILLFRVDSPQMQQVVSIRFNIEVLDSGLARLNVDSVHGGRLPLPRSMLAGFLEQHAGQRLPAEDVDRLRQVLLEGEPFEPIIPLDKTRQARLLGYTVTDDAVELTLTQEPLQEEWTGRLSDRLKEAG